MGKIKEFIWPIHKEELKKFLPMSIMLLLTLFNYNALRIIKDSLVVPNIGAEAISLIKFFCVVPAALIFVIIYTKMTNIWNFRKIYIVIASVFACFFLVFGFLLYPNETTIHPNQEMIAAMTCKQVDISIFKLELAHFKWFFLVYGKWLYALFFMVAELWSVMNILLFWQFANQVIKTNEAKRFYPMFAFMGSFGTFVAGSVIKFSNNLQASLGQDTVFLMMLLMSILALATFGIICFFEYVNRHVITDEKYLNLIKAKRPDNPLTLSESFKIVTSSKYLKYIAVLVVGYGMTINLLEGPWKASIKEIYTCTEDYVYFMAGVQQSIGICSMLFILIGVVILKRYSWLIAAMITPATFIITGSAFFIFIVFGKTLNIYLGSLFIFDPLLVAIYLGMAQNVLSKSTKYALFDPTKEMTYIPIDYQLKSKGKAAVDIIGTKIAKSGSALIQTLLFAIFPSATYLTISGFLMVLFIIVSAAWMISVVKLDKEYTEQLKKKH